MVQHISPLRKELKLVNFYYNIASRCEVYEIIHTFELRL